MNCSNCGCPLTEGYSVFCPECGQRVTAEKKLGKNIIKVMLTVLTVVSAIWIFLPVIRVAGDRIYSFSVIDLIIGTTDFDAVKISAMWWLLPVVLIPQTGSLVALFVKSGIHIKYSVVGLINLYSASFYFIIWLIMAKVSKELDGLAGYGWGLVVAVCFYLLISFFCISLSASQKCIDKSRAEIWYVTITWADMIIATLLFGLYLFAVIAFVGLKEAVVFNIILLLAYLSYMLGSVNIIRGEFSQWLSFAFHTFCIAVCGTLAVFNSSSVIKNAVGENDILGIYEYISPYVFGITVAVFAVLISVGLMMSIWGFKALKRNRKIRIKKYIGLK